MALDPKFFADSDLLELWEHGLHLHPLDRALLLLGATHGTPEKSLADWPLGRRNEALAEIRCSCFGSTLQAWITCPRCDEKLEFEVDIPTLLRGHQNGERSSEERLAVNGYSFRLPTSRDLARVSAASDPRVAAVDLLEGCRVDKGAAPVWSDADLEEIGEQMALADPMAEIRFKFVCPICAYDCDESLDLGNVLWAEIEARAKRLLFEIHTLASAYGWTEKEILSLSENRRLLYLEIVQG
jgi:hypothetical protein